MSTPPPPPPAPSVPSVPPPPPPAAADRRAKLSPRSPVFLWGVASVVLLAIGSLGPWASVLSVELSGTSDGRDGILTLILAGVAALLIGLRVWRWGVLVAGILAFATTIYDIVDITGRDAGILEPSVEWGLLLAAIAAASLCVWPFFARSRTT